MPPAFPSAFTPPPGFGAAIVRWQKKSGRQNLPWQAESDPYKIWLAEVMLQQTQVAAVIPYFREFIARFPTVQALARAPESAVLSAWSGLGYYARARNLRRAAQIIAANEFPQNADEWRKLPGVGRSTANAVAAFAFGQRVPILDGNVKRVIIRLSARRQPADNPESLRKLWEISEALVPKRADIRAFTQGMMDLGAAICPPRAPLCSQCPVKKWCRARALNIADQLPVRRPKSPRKIRTLSVYIIHRGGKILLQRRPSAGIWGGMLAPPEAKTRECKPRRDGALSAPTPLPTVIHDFTHFRMMMRPALMRAAPERVFKTPADCQWVGARELKSAPLPAPIRRELPNWLKYGAEQNRALLARKKGA